MEDRGIGMGTNDTPLVLGIDLGTTACKAVAVASDGAVAAAGSAEYPLATPEPGAAEQDVVQVWRGMIVAVRQVVEAVARRRIGAVALSGAMHSMVMVDDLDRPLAPAIIWADARAQDQVAALREETDAAGMYRRTGCPLQATYHPARLRWLRQNRTQVLSQAKRICGIKDWVLHQLTGRWGCDLSTASATGMLDLESLAWDAAALELAGIDAARLPPLVDPQRVGGALSAEAAGVLGLAEGLPVVPGATDGVLANLGAGAAADGQAAITVGTSGAVRIARRRPALDEQARTWSYVLVPGRFVCGGAINNGGLTMKWLRQRFYAGADSSDAYELMMQEAAAIAPGADGLCMLPYLAGERCPHWRQDIRAVLAGLGLHHTRAHLARAGAEAVAFCLADVVEAVQAKIVPPVRLTGGVTASRLWCGIIADVLGLAVQPVDVADASAVGAAILGHLALGHIDAIDSVQPPLDRPAIAPDEPGHRRYRELHDRWRALQPVALGGR